MPTSVHLEQEIPLNGSFRLYVFAGRPSSTAPALRAFCGALASRRSFLSVYTCDEAGDLYHERHNPHSKFFSFCTVFNAPRQDVEIAGLLVQPLLRYRDHVYADDVWDQRVPDAKAAAHAKMGLDEEKGGVVVVRPDGHVSCVVGLVGAATVDALNMYFNSFSVKQIGGHPAKL